MRKILILGSSALHKKLIVEAKTMGLHTITTDYFPYASSPGKQIADEYWDLDIFDVDGIVEKCKEEAVSAVIAGWIDICQKPYGEICKRLQLPAYATPEMFQIMTNKLQFKQLCIKNGIDVIQGYSEEEAFERIHEEPLYVKPTDSCGSHGQNVCYDEASLSRAIKEAQSISTDGKVIIEQYITGCPEFHLTYFVVDGKPHLNRTGDVYTCLENANMRREISGGTFPSIYTKHYLETAQPRVLQLIKDLGITYGPVYLQGFFDKGVFRFFDQGLRFAGTDLEVASKKASGVNLSRAMIEIALSGKTEITPDANVSLNGKKCMVLFVVGAGDCQLAEVRGVETIMQNERFLSYASRKAIGSSIDWSYDGQQYLAEFIAVADNAAQMKENVNFLNSTYQAFDADGNDIVIERFDPERILTDPESD